MSLAASARRRRRRVVLGALAALGAAGLAAGADAALAARGAVSPTMKATVLEDYTITLTFADGTPVGTQDRVPPTIPPGTYTIAVVDSATTHNFHLLGPGIDDATDVGQTETDSWTVTLPPGQLFKFQCDYHPDSMWGQFQTSGTSTSSGTGTAPGGGTQSGGTGGTGGTTVSGAGTAGSGSALAGTLTATVAATGKLTLSLHGKPVTSLEAGRYRITVTDRSRARNFELRRGKKAAIALTGTTFVGKHSSTVDLQAGTWSFFTSKGAPSLASFTVS